MGLGLVLALLVAIPHVPVALVGACLLGIFAVRWVASQQTIIQTTAPTNTSDGSRAHSERSPQRP